MIEELSDAKLLSSGKKYGKIYVPNNALSCSRYGCENDDFLGKYESTKHTRFPCSHKSELGPEHFHFEKVSPQIHHVAVPLCRDSRAIF